MRNRSYPVEKSFELQTVHIGLVISILRFCIIFLGNRQKLTLWGKEAIPEMSSELTEMIFLCQTSITEQTAEICFVLQNAPNTVILISSGVFKHSL